MHLEYAYGIKLKLVLVQRPGAISRWMTDYFFEFYLSAELYVTFTTLSMDVLATEKCFAEVAT